MDKTAVEPTDPQGQRVDEVGVVAKVTESMEGTAGEVIEGDGEPPDSVKAVPQSLTLSAPFSDAAHPPSSDACIEATDIDDPVASGDGGASENRGFPKQLKKRAEGSDDEGNGECELTIKWRRKRARGLQDLPTFTTHGKLVLSDENWLVFRKVAGSLALREKLTQVIKELNAAARGKKRSVE